MSEQTYLIPPQTGRGIIVPAGKHVQVTDIDGVQVADLWAIRADDPTEWLSTGHTRSALERLFPRVGDDFVTNRRTPILRLEGDTSPGVHDMLYPPCDPGLFVRMGLSADHPSCRSNFLKATETIGIAPPVVPDSVNLFQNSPPTADGRIPIFDAVSRPGDAVVLCALLDIALVVTSCSVDVPPGNGKKCTPIRVEVS